MFELDIDTGLLLALINECNSFCSEQFVDFVISGNVVGAVHKDRLPLLKKHSEVFQVFKDRVVLHPHLKTPKTRTQAISQISRRWCAEGVITKWCNEPCRVGVTFGAAPLMLIDRSLTTFFGILGCGVHVNGIIRKNERLFMWVSQRVSQNAILPGELDLLVAGAQPANLSVWEIMTKESFEEANIPLELAKQARSVGMIGYRMNLGNQLLRHVVINFDLELPETFEPKNNDGKIARFYLWPIEKVVKIMITSRNFKINSNLSIIDLLIRHGYLYPDDPYYKDIVRGLHDFVVNLPVVTLT
ncbi:MAG: DUF4743 domain-containing protein [Chloroflexi bacterium]|nr:DUF4743 domain-containing protein [Chloroflexota bacterium]